MLHVQMPPDTSEKEKIVGGILDGGQLIAIVVGGGIGAILAGIAVAIVGAYGIMLYFPAQAMGFYFAIKKVEGMSLYEYLRLKRKYKHKVKKYVNVESTERW